MNAKPPAPHPAQASAPAPAGHAPRLLGVIGGMGPLATVDFLRRLIALVPAARDRDHVPAMVAQIPQVEDRVGAILRDTASPLPQMLASLRRLERAGAEVLVMPCNTAHYWHPQLAAATPLPFLHIVDAVLQTLGGEDGPVGLLATRATLDAGVYARHPACAAAGVVFEPPSGTELRDFLIPAIALVKQDEARRAGPLVQACIEAMRSRGIRRIVLGCTELPVALDAIGTAPDANLIDSTDALARAAIRASLSPAGTAAAGHPLFTQDPPPFQEPAT